jgi:hypothetical protein
MLESFDFERDRVDSFIAVMNLIPTFHPDGATVASLGPMVAEAASARTAYIDTSTTLSLQRGAVNTAWEQVHDACVSVHAALRSLYRKVPSVLHTIESQPTQDQTRDETDKRAECLAATWAKLPLPPPPYPVPPGPGPHFVVPYAGMPLLTFQGLRSSAISTEGSLPMMVSAFEKEEGRVHASEAAMRDFNVAARQQGLAQFTSGWQMEVIEAIPTAPPELPPNKGEIASVEAPGGATILVRVTSARASRFRLEGRQGAGPMIVLVATWPTVRIPATLPATGAWTLRARGENAKGEGEWSDDFAVTVPA